MKAQTYGKGLAVLLFMLAALAGFAYLYKQNSGNNDNKQEHILGTIYNMKQADASWTADVLKAYVGLSKDYDTLGATGKELPQTLNQLGLALGGFPGHEAQQTSQDLERLIKDKSNLIEKFKRHNAVLKNSLRYLPTVQMEIAAQLMQEKGADPKARGNDQKEAVDQLVSLVLQYNLFPEERLAASVQLQNESLRLSFGSMSPALLERARNLVRHVDVILSERIGLAMLVQKINEVPIAERLDALSAEINKAGVTQVNGAGEQRNILLMYGVAMLAIFILIGVITTQRIVKLKEMTRNARTRLVQLERKLAEKSVPKDPAKTSMAPS
ncbi:DAHL domain-containing protein [Massilia sp. W12]|uniref:DAHL domain-containing protein n=1 Tax=Massilia sp. W12 TaxID=3126507 RepID=UPI0030D37A2A